jgi:hypothetical protein
MTAGSKDKQGSDKAAKAAAKRRREARLAEALRANLRRRKAAGAALKPARRDSEPGKP